MLTQNASNISPRNASPPEYKPPNMCLKCLQPRAYTRDFTVFYVDYKYMIIGPAKYEMLFLYGKTGVDTISIL